MIGMIKIILDRLGSIIKKCHFSVTSFAQSKYIQRELYEKPFYDLGFLSRVLVIKRHLRT